jgi:hypothetical protein
MYNHHYEMIANQRRQEIEDDAKEGWKFAISSKNSMFQRTFYPDKAADKPAISINKPETCTVC